MFELKQFTDLSGPLNERVDLDDLPELFQISDLFLLEKSMNELEEVLILRHPAPV